MQNFLTNKEGITNTLSKKFKSINDNLKKFSLPDIDMKNTLKQISDHEAKKQVQPFHTNELLRKLIKRQTPFLITALLLIFTGSTLIFTILTYFK